VVVVAVVDLAAGVSALVDHVPAVETTMT